MIDLYFRKKKKIDFKLISKYLLAHFGTSFWAKVVRVKYDRKSSDGSDWRISISACWFRYIAGEWNGHVALLRYSDSVQSNQIDSSMRERNQVPARKSSFFYDNILVFLSPLYLFGKLFCHPTAKTLMLSARGISLGDPRGRAKSRTCDRMKMLYRQIQ